MASALEFFRDEIVPRPLPLQLNSAELCQSYLLFPGKVTLVESISAPHFDVNQRYLAIADSGHHRILITSLDGKIKVKFVLFVFLTLNCFKIIFF